jgi:Flp pilus assembly protein TadD
MRSRIARTLAVAAATLWLAACSTSKNFSQLLHPQAPAAGPVASTSADGASGAETVDAQAAAAMVKADPDATGTVPEPLGVPAEAEPGMLGSDPHDDLSLGKKQYRANNFGLAEQHFRRAVELHPNDAEAWLGLAASYDRLRRFDLADRAYAQAIRIVGPTVEILNNQGFSYMLRGDYPRARAKLIEAEHKDPGNKYVLNNLKLLKDSWRQGKAVAR